MNQISIIGSPINFCSGDRNPNADKAPAILSKLIKQQFPEKIKDYGNIEFSRAHINNNNPKAINLGDYLLAAKACFSSIKAIAKDEFIVNFGGDHSCAYPSIKATLSKYPDLAVIYLDAHPDLNTDVTTISGFIHGMPVAALLGEGSSSILEIGGPITLKPENLLIIGCDPEQVDPAEYETINRLGIKFVENSATDSVTKMITAIKNFGREHQHIWLSFDLDCINKYVLPGVGMPNPNGFSKDEILNILKTINSNCNLVGMDMVEYDVSKDNNGQSALLATELLKTLLD